MPQAPMSPVDAKTARPLSPHLQIYRPIITMVMSIVHRITGIGLYAGMFLLAWYLVAASSGAQYYDFVAGLFGSILGRVILFCFTWALVHHLLGGLRHLMWDTIHGFEKETANKLALANIVGSVVLTIAIWVVALALA